VGDRSKRTHRGEAEHQHGFFYARTLSQSTIVGGRFRCTLLLTYSNRARRLSRCAKHSFHGIPLDSQIELVVYEFDFLTMTSIAQFC
jgi:hypothetical protein